MARGGVRYQDVAVVGLYINCDKPDDDLLSPAPFIRYLQSHHIPTRGLGNNDRDGVQQLALMSGPDAVTVTGAGNVSGWEREVVVYLGSTYDYWGRLYAMSRTKTHLVWVEKVYQY